MVLIKIAMVGVALIVLMNVARAQRWPQRAGVIGACVATPAPRTEPGGVWYACKEGTDERVPQSRGGRLLERRNRAETGDLALRRPARITARCVSGGAAIPVSASRTIRSATSAVRSADATPVGITSTTSIPTILSRVPSSRHAHRRSVLVIPPGSGVPVPGANAGSSTSTSTVRNVGASPTIAIVCSTMVRIPRSRTSCMKKLVIPCSACHPNSSVAGPVAAQPDLHVAPRLDVAVSHEPVHRGSVRYLDAEDLPAGVGVRVEVDEGNGAVHRGDSFDVRLRDRVVAAEDDRDRTGRNHLAHGPLDRRVTADRIRRNDGRVSEVDDAQLRHRVDLRLQVRPRRTTRAANRPRAEARSWPIRREIVHGRSDDGDIHACEVPGSCV